MTKQLDYKGPWCCEKGQAQGVPVCDECAEISAGYQSCMGPGPKTKYFALLDSEEIQFIGEFETIDDAFCNEPPCTHWVFSEEGLRSLRDSIDEVLK